MARFAPDATLEGGAVEVATADRLWVISASAADYSDVTSNALASVALTPGAGNGDFVFGNGTTGRRVTISSQSGVTATATGSGTHVALTKNDTTLVYVTTCPSVSVVNTQQVNFPSWYVEFSDPVAP